MYITLEKLHNRTCTIDVPIHADWIHRQVPRIYTTNTQQIIYVYHTIIRLFLHVCLFKKNKRIRNVLELWAWTWIIYSKLSYCIIALRRHSCRYITRCYNRDTRKGRSIGPRTTETVVMSVSHNHNMLDPSKQLGRFQIYINIKKLNWISGTHFAKFRVTLWYTV